MKELNTVIIWQEGYKCWKSEFITDKNLKEGELEYELDFWK